MGRSFDFEPPPALIGADFVIRAQRLDDTDPDYEAVMASVDWLRRWSDSPWPEDGFSRADNLVDLRGHIEEHRRGEAFGFTIATPDDVSVLGSLYVNLLGGLLAEYGADAAVRAALAGRDARCDLWTRADAAAELPAQVVSAARSWFAHAWPLAGVAWGARRDCPELERAYTAAGLQLLARLVHPDSGRVHLLYG